MIYCVYVERNSLSTEITTSHGPGPVFYKVGKCNVPIYAIISDAWKVYKGSVYIYTSKTYVDDKGIYTYFVIISDTALEFDSSVQWFGGLCDTGDKMLVEVVLENGSDIIPEDDAPKCTRKRGRDDMNCDMGDGVDCDMGDRAKQRQCC